MKLVSRYLDRLRVDKRAHDVRIDRAEDIAEWLHWGSKDIELRLVIPIKMLRMHGAFAYSGGIHPFVEALKCGAGALTEFYDAYVPTDIAAAHFIDGESRSAGPGAVPWTFSADLSLRTSTAEKGLDARHGSALHGPCTKEKVDLEMRRLRGVLHSIKRVGWRPDQYGHIRGIFLRNRDSYRFYIKSGKHRAAALAAAGYEQIQVTFSPNYPRVVDIRDSLAWPLVRRGQVTDGVARAVFQRYFEYDGSQQYRKLGLIQDGHAPERQSAPSETAGVPWHKQIARHQNFSARQCYWL